MCLGHSRLRALALLNVVLLIALACAPTTSPASPASPTEPAPAATQVPAEAAEPSSLAGRRTFVIVSDDSRASYIVDEEFLPDMLAKYGINVGRQDTVGVTTAFEGQITLNLEDLTAALGDNSFRVDLSKLESDQSLRDRWLLENGPEFSKFPEARFIATAIEGAPASYTEGEEVSFRLLGDLTVRDVTQPASFNVVAKLEGALLSGHAEAAARMTDFGIDPPNFANTLTVQDEFVIRIDFVAQAQ